MTAATETPTPPQTYLVRINRPMISVSAATAILDVTETRLEMDLECGKIVWAFNLAANPTSRRLIRLFTREILDRKAGIKSEYSLAFVVNACFPATRASFRLREISFAWHVSDLHVVNLFRSRAFNPVDPAVSPSDHTDTCHFPRITRMSLADFLTHRRAA